MRTSWVFWTLIGTGLSLFVSMFALAVAIRAAEAPIHNAAGSLTSEVDVTSRLTPIWRPPSTPCGLTLHEGGCYPTSAAAARLLFGVETIDQPVCDIHSVVA